MSAARRLELIRELKLKLRSLRSRLANIRPQDADALLGEIEPLRDQLAPLERRERILAKAQAKRNGNGRVQSSHMAAAIPGGGDGR